MLLLDLLHNFQVHESWMSRLVLGLLTIVAGCLIWFIPETRHKPLPGSITELAQWEGHKDFRFQNTDVEISYQPTDTHNALTENMEEVPPSTYSTSVQSTF